MINIDVFYIGTPLAEVRVVKSLHQNLTENLPQRTANLKKKSEKANPAIARLDLVKRRIDTKETDLKRRWVLPNQQDIIDEVSNHLKREVKS